MHGFCCQQEAAENLLAVLGVAAAGKAAPVTAQMFEPAFAQIRGAQSMAPLRWEVEKRQHLFQLALDFLPSLGRVPPTASTEAPRPVPRRRLVLPNPAPPNHAPELPPIHPSP